MILGHTRAVHLRYFLVFLFGITFGMVIMLMANTTYTYVGPMPDYSINRNPLRDTVKMYTVTVPRMYLSRLKSVDKISEEKVVVAEKDFRNGTIARNPSQYAQSLIPKGAKPVAGNIRLYNPVYSRTSAEWPPAIEWPQTWSRDVDTIANDTSIGNSGNSITCDMKRITDSLRPRLPSYFERRRFLVLPARYREISKPIPAPCCGTLGLLSPWRLLKQEQLDDEEQRKIWMLFVVKSGPDYQDNRMMVRNTWGSPEHFSKHRIFVLFVVGETNDGKVMESLRNESQIHGDLLQCDFLDHYHKLPTKVLSAFRWILERNLDVEYFTMTDDDCLVNLPNMAKFFDTRVETDIDRYKNVYCGFQHHTDAIPVRGGNKWTVTKEQYSEKYYPTFCHGGLWTLSRPLMHGIYCVSEITNIGDFFLEDVSLTGILREKLNFKETNIKRVVSRLTKKNDLMLFHAGKKKTAESSGKKMMDEWKLWQARWENVSKSG